MKCPQCAHENPSQASFCGACGSPLQPRTCPKCGKEVKPGSAFCMHCGQALATPGSAALQPNSSPGAAKLPRRRLPIWAWVLISVGVLGLITALFLLLGPPSLGMPAIEDPLAPVNTPSATNLPAATHTPLPPATATLSPFLLFDHFLDPSSGLPTMGDQSSGEAGYGDHAYCINFYQPGGYHAAWYHNTAFADFIAETEVCASDTSPSIGAGLTLRSGPNGEYLFWVYPAEKQFTFIRRVDDQYTDLIPLTRSDAIQGKKWPGQLCVDLKVVAHGNTLDLWVAHPERSYEYLASVQDTALVSGTLGPSASSPASDFSPAPAHACFNWLHVSAYYSTPTGSTTQQTVPAGCAPSVSVSLETNCRMGPGIPYDAVGSLLVGEEATIVGRDRGGTYWVINNPREPGTCWIWGQYANVTGETECLPLIQPPPSPTPQPHRTPYLLCDPVSVPYMGNFDVDGYDYPTAIGVYMRLTIYRDNVMLMSKLVGPNYADANGVLSLFSSNCMNGTLDQFIVDTLIDGVSVGTCTVTCQTP